MPHATGCITVVSRSSGHRAQGMAVKNQVTSDMTGSVAHHESNLLFDYPGFLVRRLWQIHVAMFLDEVEGAVTPIQFSILLVLRQKEWLEQGRLAGEVGIDRSNAADILPRMERAGLIQRRRSTEDRRAMLVGLTQSGCAMIYTWRSRVERSHERMLEALPVRQRAIFVRMLRRVVQSRNTIGRARMRIA